MRINKGNALEGYEGEFWLRREDGVAERLHVLHHADSYPALPLLCGESLDLLLVPEEAYGQGQRLPAALAVLAGGPAGPRVLRYRREAQRWHELEVDLVIDHRRPFRWLGALALPFAGALDLGTMPLQGLLLIVYLLTR